MTVETMRVELKQRGFGYREFPLSKSEPHPVRDPLFFSTDYDSRVRRHWFTGHLEVQGRSIYYRVSHTPFAPSSRHHQGCWHLVENASDGHQAQRLLENATGEQLLTALALLGI